MNSIFVVFLGVIQNIQLVFYLILPELDKILPNKEERENVAQLKENIRHTMSSQFQDIIDEVCIL